MKKMPAPVPNTSLSNPGRSFIIVSLAIDTLARSMYAMT